MLNEKGLVLDVGCGKRKHGDIGIDYDRNSDADIIADAEHLPFKDEAFSAVYSYNCLEHSPNPLNFLKEQYRILKSNGKITCVTDNAQYYRFSVQRFAGDLHEQICQDHYMIFYPQNVIKLMKKASFINSSFEWLPEYDDRIMHIIAMLFVKIRFWRNKCLYKRFVTNAIKKIPVSTTLTA